MKKVIIIKQVGQTGLRKVGTLCSVPDNIAKSWIKKGWAKSGEPKPKAKPKKAK